MRKTNRAAMAALAIMISCSLLGVTVAAGQAEGILGTDNSETSEEISGADSSDVGEELPDADNQDMAAEGTSDMDNQDAAAEGTSVTDNQDAVSEEPSVTDNQGAIAEETPGMDNQDVVADVPDTDSSNIAEDILNADYQGQAEIPDVNSLDTEETGSEAADVLSLQIPQKLGIVIDPWEMDGKGQIYSEQYIIRNVGEDAGVLTLSFLCRRGENSTAIIRTDKVGLHDDENKSIYIEMIFGDTERMVLAEEGLEYQVELEPGEELAVSFTGEVNENASESWGNGDVEVEGIYSWNVSEDSDAGTEANVNEAEETPNSEEDDLQSEAETTESVEEGESDSLCNGEDGEVTPEESEKSSVEEDVKDDAEVKQEDGNDALPVEGNQDKAEPETGEPLEVLPEEGKETPEQKIDDEDMTGAESQEKDQNPEIDNAEDGQEG